MNVFFTSMGHVWRRASFASLRAPFQEPILRRIIDTFHLRAIKLGNKDEFDDVDEFMAETLSQLCADFNAVTWSCTFQCPLSVATLRCCCCLGPAICWVGRWIVSSVITSHGRTDAALDNKLHALLSPRRRLARSTTGTWVWQLLTDQQSSGYVAYVCCDYVYSVHWNCGNNNTKCIINSLRSCYINCAFRNDSCLLLCFRPHRAEGLSDDAVWRLSRTSGLSREQRGLGRLKLAQG